MTTNQTIDGVPRELSVPITLTKQQERDILRFYDTCEDGQGYDVPKDRMRSLARLGLIRPTGFSRYEITDAGDAVIEKLRALLDAPQSCGACNGCQGGCRLNAESPPASQPQGVPVERIQYNDDDAQAAFEALNPMPRHVTKFKGGYAATEFNAWDAHEFCKKWDGFKQCAKLYVEQPAPVAVVLPDRDKITLSSPLKMPSGYTLQGNCNYELQIWRACIDEVTRLNTKE